MHGPFRLIRRALSLGVTFLDTADVYGPHSNEITVGKALRGKRAAAGADSIVVRQGKVRYLGLSEAAPATTCRAHKVHPASRGLGTDSGHHQLDATRGEERYHPSMMRLLDG